MRLAGKPEDYLRAVMNPTHRLGRTDSPTGTLVALGVVGAIGRAYRLPHKRGPEEPIKHLVKREVREAVKSKQPPGLNFDLFG